MELIQKEYIFTENKAAPECHASTILRMENGDFFSAWFAGEKEGRKDVMIWGSRKTKDGWSKPRVLTPEAGIPHWNPVLFARTAEELILFYKLGPAIPDWQTMKMVSRDGGLTWSEPNELIPGDTSGGRGPVKNKAIRLSNGRILAPASVERGPWRPFVDGTDDEGLSWTKRALPVEEAAPEKINMIQPTLWENPRGCVHALMRTNQGRIYRSDSADYGETWCAVYPTELPNNNSGLDCVLTENGTLVLVCNPVSTDWGKRTPLTVFTSRDNGTTFQKQLDLESEEGEFSYPAVISAGDRVFVTYTRKRQCIAFCELKV